MEPDFIDMSVLLDSGIYMLMDRGRAIYIGQSKLMLRRLYEHALAKGKLCDWAPGRGRIRFRFDEVFIRPCPIHELDELEAAMIKKYQPVLNIRRKVTAGANMPTAVRAMIVEASTRPSVGAFNRRGL